MRKTYTNPITYLSEAQLRVLARMEGMSVPEVLAKYDRIRPLSERKRPAPRKAASERKVANPLHYLTDAQLKVLALSEGMTVPEVLAKYDRIRPLSERKRPAPRKASSQRKVANPHMGEDVYVVLRRGVVIGVYEDWQHAKQVIRETPGATYQSALLVR